MDDDGQIIRFLEEQVAYLKEEKVAWLNAMETAATFANLGISLNKLEDETPILKEAATRIGSLVRLKTAAFYLVDEETSDISRAFCQPREFAEAMDAETNILIEDLTFSWALNRNKAVIVAAKTNREQVLLHSLSTDSRIRGMFVGVLDQDKETILDSVFPLLTIVMIHSAHLLQSYELYRQIRRINQNLEAQVIERTRDLAQSNEKLKTEIQERKIIEQELLSSKETAEIANRSKSEFLANMSHEIRTPMNAVLNMTDLAMQTDLKSKQREYLNIVKSSGQTLLGIINDILDLSKIETTGFEIEEGGFDLSELFESVGDIFRCEAEIKNIELILSFDKDVPCALVGDSRRLRQILVNLVSNAVKFTDRGEVHVRAECLGRFENQAEIAFEIIDTGIGMTKDTTEKIFKPFIQADMSATRKYGGTGLGLAISKQIVEMMNGRIGVRSEPGKGSVFRFVVRFPIWEGMERKFVIPGEALFALVASENNTARKAMCAFMESFGFRVETACSGKEVLEKLGESNAETVPFGLVCLDGGMRDMFLTKMLAHIRNHPGLAEIPVLVAGGQLTEEQIRSFPNVRRIDKPVGKIRLFETVLRAMSGKENPDKHRESLSAYKGYFAGHKILVVEDDAINCMVATEILGDAGFELAIAVNGKKAVEAVQNDSYDLILMDIQMPEMDGFRATERIRKIGHAQEVPIIAMTAHAMKGEREKCLRAGMNDHIPKPIEPLLLFKALAKWLKKPSGDVASAFSETAGCGPVSAPGIDINEALARLKGNRELFISLLLNFGKDYADCAQKIKSAIAGNDRDSARKLLHKLKGVSGNLSAHRLRAVAIELESALPDGHSDTLDLKAGELDDALSEILETARTFKKQKREKIEPPSEKEETEILSAIANLTQLLAEHNTDAESGLNAVKQYLRARGLWENNKTIEAQISNFDFKGALNSLEKIAESLGIFPIG